MYVYMSLIIICAGSMFVDAQMSLKAAEVLFEKFIVEYNRHYKSEEEKQMRFENFKKSLEEIRKGNLRGGAEVMGINLFSDISKEEFRRSHLGYLADNQTQSCKRYRGSLLGNAPKTLDWRKKGVVTPAKNQRNCGSCWAFSAVANIESQYAMKYKKLIDLSKQQLVDCDMSNHGCKGGSMIRAFKTLKKGGGLMEEKDYPYRAYNDSCKFNPDKVQVRVTGCLDFTGTNTEGIQELLARYGPLTVALQGTSMKDYTKGVHTFCDGDIDHALLLVGYGFDEETYKSYWILKNSWGPVWGENGFIRLHMGNRQCKVGLHQLATSQVAR